MREKNSTIIIILGVLRLLSLWFTIAFSVWLLGALFVDANPFDLTGLAESGYIIYPIFFIPVIILLASPIVKRRLKTEFLSRKRITIIFMVVAVITVAYWAIRESLDRKQAECCVRDILDCYAKADSACLRRKSISGGFSYAVFFPVESYKIDRLHLYKNQSRQTNFFNSFIPFIYPNIRVEASVTIKFKQEKYVPEFYYKSPFFIRLAKSVLREWKMDGNSPFDKSPESVMTMAPKLEDSQKVWEMYFSRYNENITDRELAAIIMYDWDKVHSYPYLWHWAMKRRLVFPLVREGEVPLTLLSK